MIEVTGILSLFPLFFVLFYILFGIYLIVFFTVKVYKAKNKSENELIEAKSRKNRAVLMGGSLVFIGLIGLCLYLLVLA